MYLYGGVPLEVNRFVLQDVFNSEDISRIAVTRLRVRRDLCYGQHSTPVCPAGGFWGPRWEPLRCRTARTSSKVGLRPTRKNGRFFALDRNSSRTMLDVRSAWRLRRCRRRAYSPLPVVLFTAARTLLDNISSERTMCAEWSTTKLLFIAGAADSWCAIQKSRTEMEKATPS